MAQFQIFGLEIDFHLSLHKVRQVTLSIPDWADDTHIACEEGKYLVKYFQGATPYYRDLPKCKEASVVHLTPMTYIEGGVKARSTGRTITVKLIN